MAPSRRDARRRAIHTTVGLWPQLRVVEELAGPRMQQAFHDLLMIFLEHASDDAFTLMPGHAFSFASGDEAGPLRAPAGEAPNPAHPARVRPPVRHSSASVSVPRRSSGCATAKPRVP